MPLWEGPEKHGVLPAQTEVLYRRMWENETTFLQTSCIFWHPNVDFLTGPGAGAEEAWTLGQVGVAEASGSAYGISIRVTSHGPAGDTSHVSVSAGTRQQCLQGRNRRGGFWLLWFRFYRRCYPVPTETEPWKRP